MRRAWNICARYYDPVTGRLTGADTVQPNAEGTQGWNLYSYVANNPTTWVDPTGHTAAAAAAAIPQAPTLRGATHSAPYIVGALAQGALTALGLRIRDALTFLSLVFAGAWTLVDIWTEVQEGGDEREKTCRANYDINVGLCETSAWAKGQSYRARICCKARAADVQSVCLKGNPWPAPPMPWESGYDKDCDDDWK